VALVVLRALASGAAAAAASSMTLNDQPGLVRTEFIYEQAPFPSCHASTIAESPTGLIAGWFGGPEEGHPQVAIWTARHDGSGWLAPVQVADGVQPGDQKRHPCWNPVLYQVDGGPLLLFYKVGPNPRAWWGLLITSADGGRTWSPPQRLPEGQVGPVRSKPVAWSDGAILCGSSTEDQGWRVHLELTPDQGRTWERAPALNDGRKAGLIQPTILKWPAGPTQILCRSQQRKIFESWMGHDWKSWSPPQPILLPNPNSGIDAVMLKDGRALLVYNHTPRGRSPLNGAVSADGRKWQAALVLEREPGEYSYPAVIQTRDGLVHATYTWKRQRIRHVVIDPAKLVLRDILDDRWPE
jgi:predicted neuraminidase